MNTLNICKQQYNMHLQPLGHPDVPESQVHLTAIVSASPWTYRHEGTWACVLDRKYRLKFTKSNTK